MAIVVRHWPYVLRPARASATVAIRASTAYPAQWGARCAIAPPYRVCAIVMAPAHPIRRSPQSSSHPVGDVCLSHPSVRHQYWAPVVQVAPSSLEGRSRGPSADPARAVPLAAAPARARSAGYPRHSRCPGLPASAPAWTYRVSLPCACASDRVTRPMKLMLPRVMVRRVRCAAATSASWSKSARLCPPRVFTFCASARVASCCAPKPSCRGALD